MFAFEKRFKDNYAKVQKKINEQFSRKDIKAGKNIGEFVVRKIRYVRVGMGVDNTFIFLVIVWRSLEASLKVTVPMLKENTTVASFIKDF